MLRTPAVPHRDAWDPGRALPWGPGPSVCPGPFKSLAPILGFLGEGSEGQVGGGAEGRVGRVPRSLSVAGSQPASSHEGWFLMGAEEAGKREMGENGQTIPASQP